MPTSNHSMLLVRIVLSVAITLTISSTCFAAPIFYVSPGTNPTGDTAWQSAVNNNFTELNLDDFPTAFGSSVHINSLQAGNVSIGLSLSNPGTALTVEVFKTIGQNPAFGGVFGTVFDNALLNRDPNGGQYQEIVFSFSTPVAGFGVWALDDFGGGDLMFEIIATEVGGAPFVSPILDNNRDSFVEGFIGVTSNAGLTEVVFRSTNTGGFYELDHLQLAELRLMSPVPEPSSIVIAIALACCCLASCCWRRRILKPAIVTKR